jgi:hypothetical protein
MEQILLRLQEPANPNERIVNLNEEMDSVSHSPSFLRLFDKPQNEAASSSPHAAERMGVKQFF